MDPDQNRIERLKRALYSRDDDVLPKQKSSHMMEREVDVPTNWGTPKTFDITGDMITRKNNSFFNKLLLYSIGFFVVCLGVASFIFFGGINMISSNNLDIKIIAPGSVSSGEEFDMNLSIVNANRTDLEEVFLFINYPEGSRSVSDESQILTRDKISLGTITRGAVSDYSVRSTLFGEKDSIKTFNLKIEYKVKGSNATFSKEKNYDVSIGSSPVLLDVNYPNEINSGQELKLSINISSNSSTVVKDTLVKIEYPPGFTYKDSSQKPFRDNSLFSLGDLSPEEKKTLRITGSIVGSNMDDRSFRVIVGTKSNDNSKDFDTSLAESQITVGIRKSFFGLEVHPSSQTSPTVGSKVPVDIRWQNTLSDKILSARIEAQLSGNVFDRNDVSPANDGFYRSINNTVVWDKSMVDSLSEMSPGDSGGVSLTVSSITDSLKTKSIKNPYINLRVVMSGDRSGNDSGEISSTQDLSIKFLSTVSLTAKSYKNTGPFTNTGPVPPKADRESTYTVTWVVTNTANDMKDTTVSATIPAGVSWKGEVSPATEKINFNPDTKTITWNIGNMAAGVGFVYSPKTVSFKLSIIPSVSQVGTVPALTSSANLNSFDTFVGANINTVISSPVSTETSDSSFGGAGVVVK